MGTKAWLTPGWLHDTGQGGASLSFFFLKRKHFPSVVFRVVLELRLGAMEFFFLFCDKEEDYAPVI